MRKYQLTRTFITKDGSLYPQKPQPYHESELPKEALQPPYSVLVDDGFVTANQPKTVEKNIVETHYNSLQNPNVIKQHFEPKYHQPDPLEEPIISVDLNHLNSPDHVLQEAPVPIVLGQATAEQIAGLPYVSRKTADKLIQALADGQVFSSMADLDKAFKLGFGAKWESTGVVLHG